MCLALKFLSVTHVTINPVSHWTIKLTVKKIELGIGYRLGTISFNIIKINFN